MVKAVCFNEKKNVDVKDPQYELNKIGRAVVRGKCPDCGATVYKILKNEEIPNDLRTKMANFKKPKNGGGSTKSKRSNSRASAKSKRGGSQARRSRTRSRKTK